MEITKKILFPSMVEPHFSLLEQMLKKYGYDAEVIRDTGEDVLKTGLKYVHNDMCYPAILVIGQLIHALESGKYDPDKVSLAITQTGGGCRASNYIYLLRKALEKAGFGNVKVYSVNAKQIDDNTLAFPVKMLIELTYGIFLSDLAKQLYNQARAHEINKGDSLKALEEAKKIIMREKVNKHYKAKAIEIIKLFNDVKRDNKELVRVGIVGEIYLKYSPLGNNHLEDYLISQGVEPVVSSVLDFGLYCLENNLIDHHLYSRHTVPPFVIKLCTKFGIKKEKELNELILKYSNFKPGHTFDELRDATKGIIGIGTKMGEGWLLSAEISTYMKHDVKNIISCQPFGCLPNHIVAKGIQNNIRKIYPDANIIAIDYDSSIARANQENRINLMIMNAKKKVA